MNKLMNETTTVPARRTVSEIQEILMEFGAYDVTVTSTQCNGKVDAIKFTLMMTPPNGGPVVPVPFRLPANIRHAQEILWNEYREETPKGKKTKQDFESAAENVAWRVLKSWIHAQVSIIRIGMASPAQVFLAYAWDERKRQTFFDRVMSDKLLEPHVED